MKQQKEPREPDGKDPHWDRELPKKQLQHGKKNPLTIQLELNREAIKTGLQRMTEWEGRMDKRFDDLVGSVHEIKELLKEYFAMHKRRGSR